LRTALFLDLMVFTLREMSNRHPATWADTQGAIHLCGMWPLGATKCPEFCSDGVPQQRRYMSIDTEQTTDSNSPLIPEGQILEFKHHGYGTGVHHSVEIKDSDHTIIAEGHPAFGGTDSAPSPLDYVLAGLISCNQVTAQIVALGKNIELGEFNIDLKADLDNSVLVYGAEGNANFTSIDLEVEVESKLSEEEFTEFVSEVERRCPLTQLYVRSGVNVRNNWTNKPLA